MDLLANWMSHLKKIEPILGTSEGKGDMKQITFKINEEGKKFNPNQIDSFILQNPFRLTSAYSVFSKFYYESNSRKCEPEVRLPKFSTYEPLFTSKSVSAFLTVDYVWFVNMGKQYESGLRVRGLYELPRLPQIKKVFFFPNRIYPSDHFPLIVDFEINL